MVRGSKTALASTGQAVKPQGVKAPQVFLLSKMYKMFDIYWRRDYLPPCKTSLSFWRKERSWV
ncbi:MAG: hypothetical protein CFE32_15695 [Alphaproteobacteria bacterium PA3]|nr:MAG: hypothetical protein CFE32_15695 [Alphaproteobacteria bacterium PA3]